MFSRRNILATVVASFIAVLAIVLGGGRNPLRADDLGACIIGGSGPLCWTITTQTCTEWKLVTIGGGATGVTAGLTCARWETKTVYYYNDTGSGGSGGDIIIKPPLM